MNPCPPERCAKFSRMSDASGSCPTRPALARRLSRRLEGAGRCCWQPPCWPAPTLHAAPGDDTVLQAREALRKKDSPALASARYATAQQQHALAMWVDYWELGNRLGTAQQADLDAFYARWPGTYVEDRLRNDWLLELGKRRDWVNLRTEFPRFRMNDDREVSCYALLARHLDGQDVRQAARAAWFAQRDLDDGCTLMASTLFEAKALNADDAWHELRLSIENNRPRAARGAAALLGPAVDKAVAQLLDNPARYLASAMRSRQRRRPPP